MLSRCNNKLPQIILMKLLSSYRGKFFISSREQEFDVIMSFFNVTYSAVSLMLEERPLKFFVFLCPLYHQVKGEYQLSLTMPSTAWLGKGLELSS